LPPLVILAGGLGTRLRPLTEIIPKPMIPLGGKPLLEHLATWYRGLGFNKIYVAANYKGVVIRDYVAGKSLGLQVRILDSKDTIDGVRLLAGELEGEIVVSMGDIITNIDVAHQYNEHRKRGADATISLVSVDNPLQFGLVMVDESGKILLFTEKPISLEVYLLSLAFHKTKGASTYSNLVNAGVYVIGERALELITSNPSLLDFGRHLFPMMVEEGYMVHGYVASHGIYWEDVGTLERYRKVMWDLLSGYIPGYRVEGLTLSSGVHVHKEAEVKGLLLPPVYVGKGAVVEEGAVVGPYASLEGDVVVKHGAKVEYSIVWWGSFIGENSYVRESIVLNNTRIQGVKVVGSVVGAGNVLEEDAYSITIPNKVV